MVEARIHPATRLLLAITSLVTAARMIWASSVELAPDEAYYWAWSRHVALGYRDHPPLLAWIESLIPTMLGAVSEVWVRLPAIVSGFILIPALYVLIRAAGVRRSLSLPAALAGGLCPIASAGAVILTPDSPLSVLWVLALAASVAYATGGHRLLFPLASIASALAVLAKLSGLLLVPVLVASLLTRRESPGGRFWTISAGLLPLAAALAILAAGEHGQPVGPVMFQLQRMGEASFLPLGPIQLLAAQVGLVGVLPVAGVVVLFRAPRKATGSATQVLMWGFWPTMAILVPLSAVIHVEVNWASVALPSLCAGWALLLERTGRRRMGKATALAWSGTASCALLSALVYLHSAGVLAPGLVGRGPAARLHGWRALVRVMRASAPPTLETGDYRLWAPIAYYGRSDPRIVLLPEDDPRRCPEARWVFRVTDARLGLAREVTGCAQDDGSALIRSSGR